MRLSVHPPLYSGIPNIIYPMTTYTFLLDPMVFTIESDCETPEEALRKELKCGTEAEVFLLDYLHWNIDDYPTLNGSVRCIDTEDCDQ